MKLFWSHLTVPVTKITVNAEAFAMLIQFLNNRRLSLIMSSDNGRKALETLLINKPKIISVEVENNNNYIRFKYAQCLFTFNNSICSNKQKWMFVLEPPQSNCSRNNNKPAEDKSIRLSDSNK